MSGEPASSTRARTRLSSAIMEALTWDCAHTGQPVNGECADCARLRDAILAAAEPILHEAPRVSDNARCSCAAGVPSARICGGDATGPDGLCDYCRESEWCVQWRTEQWTVREVFGD